MLQVSENSKKVKDCRRRLNKTSFGVPRILLTGATPEQYHRDNPTTEQGFCIPLVWLILEDAGTWETPSGISWKANSHLLWGARLRMAVLVVLSGQLDSIYRVF